MTGMTIVWMLRKKMWMRHRQEGVMRHVMAAAAAGLLLVALCGLGEVRAEASVNETQARRVEARLKSFPRNAINALPTIADVPPALAWHTSDYLHISDSIDFAAAVIGGARLDTPELTKDSISPDVWLYIASVFTWTRCYIDPDKPQPQPLVLHSAITLNNHTTLAVFGGASVDPDYNFKNETGSAFEQPFVASSDLWFLTARPSGEHGIEHSHECLWEKAAVVGPTPSSRSGHAASAFFDDMFIFGGCSTVGDAMFFDTLDYCDPDNLLDDLWHFHFDSSTWTRLTLSGPAVCSFFFASPCMLLSTLSHCVLAPPPPLFFCFAFNVLVALCLERCACNFLPLNLCAFVLF